VIGATGLVGKQIVINLLSDDRYSKVKIFVRRESGIVHPKLEEHLLDFDLLEGWKHKITGDELFSALGTTIKKAGGREAQHKVDFGYQYDFAAAAAANGVENFFLVSSAGAGSSSNNFYLRMKRELEEKIAGLAFKKIVILRPSLLAGKREELRMAEKIGFVMIIFLMKIVPFLKKYKPISGDEVSRAMIKSANENLRERITIYELSEIFKIIYPE
jgi:uncharacterized protein YbjT (DUF2867 family)